MTPAERLSAATDLAEITEHSCQQLEQAAWAPDGSPASRWLADLINAHVATATEALRPFLIVRARHASWERPIEWREVVLWHRERLGLL